MTSQLERACVIKSNEIQLDRLVMTRVPFLIQSGGRISDIDWEEYTPARTKQLAVSAGSFIKNIVWEEDTEDRIKPLNAIDRIKRIALLPVFLLAYLTLIILGPIAHIMDLWELRQDKKKTRNLIDAAQTDTAPIEVPDEKTLEALWSLHGLPDGYRFSVDERLGLLNEWIEILYGKVVAKNLNLESRLDTMYERHADANHSWYMREEGAVKFFFPPEFDTLLQQLTKELPPYEPASGAGG